MIKPSGTRFLLYPQAPVGQILAEPDVIWVNLLPGQIQAGPSDERMYVVNAIAKPAPYDKLYVPPYDGSERAPVEPGRDGHFDTLEPGTHTFNAAHMYAAIRCVLEIWEGYFGRPIPWHFASHYARLELIPYLDWDNAQSGFGFIEAGYGDTEQGERTLHCLNFDVLAHELGHSIVYSEVGIPSATGRNAEYFAFHEAAADVTALIAVLHFESVVDRLLRQSQGNLYTLNELNRIGELSEIEQIRVASNDHKMSEFRAGWHKEHDLSLPLTGAIFDVLVDLYQYNLAQRGLISSQLARLSLMVPDPALDYDEMHHQYAIAYEQHHAGFKAALLDARDYLGYCLALTWQNLSAEHLTFTKVGAELLAADRVFSAGRHQEIILNNFLWREVGQVPIGPRLSGVVEDYVFSCR